MLIEHSKICGCRALINNENKILFDLCSLHSKSDTSKYAIELILIKDLVNLQHLDSVFTKINNEANNAQRT